jgi:hypothetical protein
MKEKCEIEHCVICGIADNIMKGRYTTYKHELSKEDVEAFMCFPCLDLLFIKHLMENGQL